MTQDKPTEMEFAVSDIRLYNHVFIKREGKQCLVLSEHSHLRNRKNVESTSLNIIALYLVPSGTKRTDDDDILRLNMFFNQDLTLMQH